VAVGFGEAKDDGKVVSNPLECRELDADGALGVEQDERVLDCLEGVLDSKTTEVGDRGGGERPIADVSADPDRRAGREEETPSVRVQLHVASIAVARWLPRDRLGSF
jgi:hypothetical protein